MTWVGRTVGVEPWDTEWAAERAAEALRYLGRNAPEVLENTSVPEPHEEAAHRAVLRANREGISKRSGAT